MKHAPLPESCSPSTPAVRRSSPYAKRSTDWVSTRRNGRVIVARRSPRATPRTIEPRGGAMATYIVLGKLTDQGIKNVKDMPNRRAARQKSAESFGITLKDGHLTMGQYDVVFTLDAPNDE